MSVPGLGVGTLVQAGTRPPQGKLDLSRELAQLGQKLQRTVVPLQLLLAVLEAHDQEVASSLTCRAGTETRVHRLVRVRVRVRG